MNFINYFRSKVVSESEVKYAILGANLLHLLTENKLADFHSEVWENVQSVRIVIYHNFVVAGTFVPRAAQPRGNSFLYESRSASDGWILRPGSSIRK